MIKLKVFNDSGKEFIRRVEAFLNDDSVVIIKDIYCAGVNGTSQAYITYKDVKSVKSRRSKPKKNDNSRGQGGRESAPHGKES